LRLPLDSPAAEWAELEFVLSDAIVAELENIAAPGFMLARLP